MHPAVRVLLFAVVGFGAWALGVWIYGLIVGGVAGSTHIVAPITGLVCAAAAVAATGRKLGRPTS